MSSSQYGTPPVEGDGHNTSMSNENNGPGTPTPSNSSNPSTIGDNIHSPTTEGILDEGCDFPAVEKSRLKSQWWKHYERKKVNGVDKAECNYCKKLIGGNTKNGTTHLKDHYFRCPRRMLVDLRQKAITNSYCKADVKQKLTSYSFDQDTARRELSNMIIMHEYPLSMVEHIGFRRYSSALQPVFKCPSRSTIKSDILKIYDYEKARTMKLLEKNESRVAITTDMWTSSNQKKGFMAITAHFVDSSWTLQSRILRFVCVPCPHTKDVICDVLIQCLMDWNVDTKLSTITLDNCSTNDAMVDVLLDKLQERSLLLSGSMIHMRCCAHILNLIVKDGLEVIKGRVEKVRDSVSYWTATPKRVEKFEETARQLRIPFTKKLALDCPTRWNSTYLMLQTALMYMEVFSRLKQHESQYKNYPTDQEWEFARVICGKLKLFYSVTEIFSGTKFPTANEYFSKICEIRLSLFAWLNSPTEVETDMASRMLDKFDKYWDVIHGIMGVVAVFDPRYKMPLLEYYFPKVYPSDSSHKIERITELCHELINEYQLRLSLDKIQDAGSCSHSDLTNSGGDDALSEYDLYVSRRKRSRTTCAKTELDHYLEEDVLPRSIQNFDILMWWKLNGVKYPTLQAIARDLLVIPVSTVASESAFSTSGRLVSPHRSRFHPKTLEALMCAQNWLWAAERKDGDLAASTGYATIYDDIDSDDKGDCDEVIID